MERKKVWPAYLHFLYYNYYFSQIVDILQISVYPLFKHIATLGPTWEFQLCLILKTCTVDHNVAIKCTWDHPPHPTTHRKLKFAGCLVGV